MNEKHKKEADHKRLSKQNNGYGMLILLVVGIIGVATYLILESNPHILDSIFAKPEKIESPKEPVIAETSNDWEKGTQEEIIPNESNEQEEDTCPLVNEAQMLSPYDQEVESSNAATHIMPEESPVNSIKDYRIYLANANELLIKFYNDIDYSKNLSVLRQWPLPRDIEEIMVLFEEYNNLLQTISSDNEKVSLFTSDIFEKFLKIRKESPMQTEMKNLKIKIESKIWLFNEYIFSAQMQEAFLK